MATYKRFEDLPAWNAALHLAVAIFKLTERESFKFKGDLVNQLQRAALSVSNNMAEGFERGSTQELISFLYNARGSAGEVRSMLRFALHLGEMPDDADEMRALVAKCEELSRQIRAWLDSIQNSDIKGQRHLNEASRHEYVRRKGRDAFNARKAEFGDALGRRVRGEIGDDELRETAHRITGRLSAGRAAREAGDGAMDASKGNAPKCPECGKNMVERKTRDGREFWGCPGYPECRGTRSMGKTGN